ncbi:hypothetical protein OO013_18935 [Mangrovivirga sp. M17]|uniref:DUF4139 domain-containing protein n=1 Tax=Mangrovivirga halotolerans TaxID=2993936 RepID=A0ABT3RW19_9BACT|nr:hypothetical protein [Mangrovivirga halotolerans]MCX2745964.1 hypothetical protein [Mangrovivirga halotolerans]
MKRIFQLFFIFISLSYSSHAQQEKTPFEVRIGATDKMRKGMRQKEVLGYDGQNIIVLKTVADFNFSGEIKFPYDKFELTKFDSQLKSLKSETTRLKVQGSRLTIEKVTQVNNNIYVIYSYQDSGSKNWKLAAKKINKKSLVPESGESTIIELDYDGDLSYYDPFIIKKSTDNKQLLVYTELPYKKDEKENFSLQVIDSEMQQLWRKDVTIPVESALFSTEDLLLDNYGNVQLLGKIYDSKNWTGRAKEKKDGEANYNFQLYSFYQQGKTQIDYPIEVEGKFFNNMNITVGDNENVICTGFYSEDASLSAKGLFYLKVNAKTKQIETKSFEDVAVIAAKEGKSNDAQQRIDNKVEKDKSVELDYLYIGDVIPKSDGGFTIIAESYYNNTMMDNSQGLTTTATSHHFGDIYVFNFNAEGSLDWVRKIQKDQKELEHGSYDLAIVGSKLFLGLKMDMKDLQTERDDSNKAIMGRKRFCTSIIEIDMNGKRTDHILYKWQDLKLFFVPNGSSQASSTEWFLYNFYPNDEALIKVKFKAPTQSTGPVFLKP